MYSFFLLKTIFLTSTFVPVKSHQSVDQIVVLRFIINFIINQNTLIKLIKTDVAGLRFDFLNMFLHSFCCALIYFAFVKTIPHTHTHTFYLIFHGQTPLY